VRYCRRFYSLRRQITAYFLNDPKWLMIIPVAILVVGLTVAALPIKRKVTPERWALELEPHLLGTDGTFDWDDAISVRLTDPRLEALRLKMSEFDSLPTAPFGSCSSQVPPRSEASSAYLPVPILAQVSPAGSRALDVRTFLVAGMTSQLPSMPLRERLLSGTNQGIDDFSETLF